MGTMSSQAWATKIVVPPIVARGAPSQIAANMTALISSELEFLGDFDEVNQLEKRPSVLGPNCLGSTPCLAGIARTGGSSTLLAGKVTKYGEEFEVALTYMESNKIVRTVKRRMSTEPMAVADELASLVRFAVTGVDPAAKAAEDRVSGFEGGGLALMDDEEDEDDDDDLLMAAPAVTSVASSDPLGRSGDDLDDDLDEDPDEGGGIAYGVVGAAGGAAAATAASRSGGGAAGASRAAAAAPEDFDPNAISFGGSVEDISFGSASAMIQVDDPPEDPSDADAAYEDDFDEIPQAAPTRRTRREPEPRSRRPEPRTRRPQPRSRNTRSSSSEALEVIGRTGFAKFQSLNFITYGIEAAYAVTPQVSVVAGLEAYSTKQTFPANQVAAGQPTSFWNTVLPLKIGAKYRMGEEGLRPYVGGDLQFIPSYVNVEGGGALAFGLRANGGVDYMMSDTFGMTAGAATGLWTGSSWYKIEGLMNTGFTLQISAGALMTF